jgi:hypothetical protein
MRFSWALYYRSGWSRAPYCIKLGMWDSRTWGGPSIVPFQLVIIRSSPSARPYEHASSRGCESAFSSNTKWPTCAQAFLAFLQLFQQPEVARNFCCHGGRGQEVVERDCCVYSVCLEEIEEKQVTHEGQQPHKPRSLVSGVHQALAWQPSLPLRLLQRTRFHHDCLVADTLGTS